MINHEIVIITDLPLVENGKMESAALRVRSIFAGDIHEDTMETRGYSASLVLIPKTLEDMEDIHESVLRWVQKTITAQNKPIEVRYY